ncbi:MinD/ParA family ATP-binding protein [Candidatus Oscillochloris fontis]|uniref:MinD/ParA family ATP-binding protein n=1 Tax=Candidatus Oscillochloris fontis TaxID=2496868 RepID=UPI001376378F|nr:MinD/ParA family protein [Candidatus Oscillochloris fontis]
MTPITVIHSFRRGTGKSSIAANLAVLLADGGLRVGLIDANLQSPSLHLFFGIDDLDYRLTINDYLAGRCELRMVATDVTHRIASPPAGKVVLVPASGETEKILETLRGVYRAETLSEGLAALAEDLHLDMVLVDTAAGLSEETLLTIAIADHVLLLLRPDHQDYYGTGVLIDLAHRLGAPDIRLIVNEVPVDFDAGEVALRVASVFSQPVVAVLHHSESLQTIGSGGLFVRRTPNAPIARALRQIAAELV